MSQFSKIFPEEGRGEGGGGGGGGGRGGRSGKTKRNGLLKIGFRDNRVGWLRFESIHLRKSLGEMRKETSGKYWFSKSVWRIRLLNKRAFCQGDTWQAR